MIMELPYQPGLSTSGLALIFLSHTAKGNPNCYTAPDERKDKGQTTSEFSWEKYDDWDKIKAGGRSEKEGTASLKIECGCQIKNIREEGMCELGFEGWVEIHQEEGRGI